MRPFRVLPIAVSLGILITFLSPETVMVQVLSGQIAVTATTPTALRQWDTWVDRMVRDGGLQLRQSHDDTLIDGRTHQRFGQYYEGVPVFGGDIVRQLDRGLTVSIYGTAYTAIDLDTTAALSHEEATGIIETLSGTALPPSSAPELTILPRTETGGYVLTYRARVMSQTDLTMYFIDAHSGDVVLQFSDLKTQRATLPCDNCDVGDATGVLGDRKKISVRSAAGVYMASDELRPPTIATYDMRGSLNKTIDVLRGVRPLFDSDFATDTDNLWTDGANVDAHVYAGFTYDYLFKRFGYPRGLDNNNVPIISLVHPVRRQDVFNAPVDVLYLYYLNAFYSNGVVVFGEGLPPGIPFLGQSWNFFAAALDIVAHELTHGVTDVSSQLKYQNESGALNEAFSDIIATSVEFFFQESGTGMLKADYLIGEDAVTPRGFRSMRTPGLFGHPDHYSNRFTGSGDNGGVHINSGIVNNAFYLAIEGGTNRTSRLAVQGVGAANREQIEKVFYRAFVFMLPSNATFSVARAATIQAARDLYGAGSTAEQAVTEAWTAVGVS